MFLAYRRHLLLESHQAPTHKKILLRIVKVRPSSRREQGTPVANQKRAFISMFSFTKRRTRMTSAGEEVSRFYHPDSDIPPTCAGTIARG